MYLLNLFIASISQKYFVKIRYTESDFSSGCERKFYFGMSVYDNNDTSFIHDLAFYRSNFKID